MSHYNDDKIRCVTPPACLASCPISVPLCLASSHLLQMLISMICKLTDLNQLYNMNKVESVVRVPSVPI